MAHFPIVVCLAILAFPPVTPSLSSFWRRPSVQPHLRHHGHSRPSPRADAQPGHYGGADKASSADHRSQRQDGMEKDAADPSDMTDASAEDWSTPSPSQPGHRREDLSQPPASRPEDQHLHPDQQQSPIQDSSSLLDSERKPWREAGRFNRTGPKKAKQKTGSSNAVQHPKPSFLSRFLSLLGNASKKSKKEGQQRRTGKKQENRPRWYFRSGEHKDSGDLRAVLQAERADRDREQHGDSAAQPALTSPPRVYKSVKEEGEEEEEGEKRGKRPLVARKTVSGREKRKSAGQRKWPAVKECVGCTETEARIAEARELHKQVLAVQLLDKLRLEPTLTDSPLPPKLPDQVFPHLPQQDHPGYHDDQYYAKPTQLMVFGQDLGRHRLRKARTGSYKFNIYNKVKGEVTQADLWVYKMPDARDSQGQTLVVTQLHYTSSGRRLRERSLVTRLDTKVGEGWVRVDVTRLVQGWLQRLGKASSSPPMLAVRCKTCLRSSYRTIFGVKSNFRPVLVMRERQHPPEDSPRDKRSSQCDPNTRCCKFDLTVRFHDLGIHEIIYPKTIRTGYCFGTCERPDLHHHNHTMIIQRLRYSSYSPVDDALRQRLRPCCVPVVLQEASVMHYVNEGRDTQVSLVPNLLVDRCGCA